MKTLKIGIAPYQEMKAHDGDCARRVEAEARET